MSATELTSRALQHGGADADAFIRQLAWRDFHHQVIAARPRSAGRDYRPRGDRWRTGRAADADFRAWQQGRTGFPVVDAGMRQLAREGYLHNRARLIVGSFLVKTLYLDWRRGAQHFFRSQPLAPGRAFRPRRRLRPPLRPRTGGTPRLGRAPALDAAEDAAGDPRLPGPIVDLQEAAARFQEARNDK